MTLYITVTDPIILIALMVVGFYLLAIVLISNGEMKAELRQLKGEEKEDGKLQISILELLLKFLK